MEKRTILWHITFWGFAINYMVRTNINIAIVSMVKLPIQSTNVTTGSECVPNIVFSTLNNTLVQRLPTDLDDNRFKWDEYQRNAVLGAFFTLYMVMQIPGGILAQRYGTKTVFGLSNGLAALLSFVIPMSAKINYQTLVGVRLIQGLVSGGAWPSMHTMTAYWIPAHERSRFVSAYLGSSVGTAITYVMCGYLIAMFDWESVFYASGVLGLFWFICWTLFVYDTPAKHPTISDEEKTYIENCISNTVHTSSKPLPIPWKSLLKSKALFINLLSQAGSMWGYFTLSVQAPTYFNFILGLNIKQAGLWSGMPHIFRWTFSFGFGMMCDRLIKSKTMSLTNIRKFATFFSNILQGVFILSLCYCNCNSMVSIIMLICATCVNGAVSSGSLAAVVDFAPNYAGVIQGIIGTFGTCTGIVSPIIVGYFTANQQTSSQWNKVFYLSGVICISTGLAYIFFGTSDVQKWNSCDNRASNEREIKLSDKKAKKTTL